MNRSESSSFPGLSKFEIWQPSHHPISQTHTVLEKLFWHRKPITLKNKIEKKNLLLRLCKCTSLTCMSKILSAKIIVLYKPTKKKQKNIYIYIASEVFPCHQILKKKYNQKKKKNTKIKQKRRLLGVVTVVNLLKTRIPKHVYSCSSL